MEKDRTKEDYNNYSEKIVRIGKGPFGIVYKVKDKKSNELKAIKIIDIESYDDIENDERIEGVMNEIKNMKKCSENNEFSVKYYEYFINKTEAIIVMELCDDNLVNILRKKKKGFSSKEILKMMIELNETFKKMVNNNIVHRDIQLQNILVKYVDNEPKNFIVKLAGYGISEDITNSKFCKDHAGSSLIMAPEILEFKGIYDNKYDLWSVGVIIYQLYFNELPYKASTEVTILNNIKKLGQKILKNTDNEDLDNLIRGLLVYDSDKRLSWDKYFEHPFFCLEQKRIKEDYTKYYEKRGDRKIGKGGLGIVYKAKDKVTNELRAMKIIDIEGDEEESEREIEQLIKELKNMDKCCNDYKNIYSVKIYDYFITKYEFIVIMELCDNNLYKYLRDRKKGFSSEEILKIMTQLNETFKIMVKENIVHQNIKLENIL